MTAFISQICRPLPCSFFAASIVICSCYPARVVDPSLLNKLYTKTIRISLILQKVTVSKILHQCVSKNVLCLSRDYNFGADSSALKQIK